MLLRVGGILWPKWPQITRSLAFEFPEVFGENDRVNEGLASLKGELEINFLYPTCEDILILKR